MQLALLEYRPARLSAGSMAGLEHPAAKAYEVALASRGRVLAWIMQAAWLAGSAVLAERLAQAVSAGRESWERRVTTA